MNQIGTEQTYPNGYREQTPGTGASDYSSVATSKTTSQTTEKTAKGAKGDEPNVDSIANFARAIQTKVKEIPYIVPITIGGVAFTLGVLASSRILRQAVLIAGGFAVRYAIKNAPRDEIMTFAKKVVTNSFKQAQTA